MAARIIMNAEDIHYKKQAGILAKLYCYTECMYECATNPTNMHNWHQLKTKMKKKKKNRQEPRDTMNKDCSPKPHQRGLPLVRTSLQTSTAVERSPGQGKGCQNPVSSHTNLYHRDSETWKEGFRWWQGQKFKRKMRLGFTIPFTKEKALPSVPCNAALSSSPYDIKILL